MIRYLKQYKFLLFLTVLFTAISSLSYVFIAILLQQVMDIVDMGDMDGFIRILLFSLAYFALMGVFMYLQSLFSKKFVCKIMKAVRSKTFMGIEKHTIEDYSKNHTADYLSAITNDVKMLEDNFLLPLLQVIQYTIIFISSLAVMIYFDIIVTVCVIIAIAIMLIVPSLFGGLLSKRQDKYRKQDTDTKKSPTFNKMICVEDLHFSYDKENEVINGISLSIKKGKKYAFVGKSGCGKSTLIKLIAGYYSDFKGNVLYDEDNLSIVDIDKITSLSSIIHQNVYMFDESILDNICLHEDYSKEELQSALSDSGLLHFIEQVPNGLEYHVGENGNNLSGGQKQRIAVARALIRKKPLLILDEGTSAIDMQTAYDIESRLLEISDLTLLTITHNMSKDILELYDEIIFMGEGKIIEHGTFETLIDKHAAFYDFYQLKK